MAGLRRKVDGTPNRATNAAGAPKPIAAETAD
jgi:hypothetical protein